MSAYNLQGAGGVWLGVGFPVIVGQMVGATAVLGSSVDGVRLHALSAKF